VDIIGMIFVVIGAIASLIGAIWIVVLAFQESIGWGIGSLLCGIVTLIYGISRWPETKVPLLLMIAGVIVEAIGQAIAGGKVM
jgi:hypothetical protein